MGYANERWFTDADTLKNATGESLQYAIQARYGVPVTDKDGLPPKRPEGGIVNPAKVIVEIGTRLVRFDRTSRPSLAVQGNWWLRWSEYERLGVIARAAAMDFNHVFRELCYVPEEWNNLHVVVQVRVVEPLLAYEGPGVPVAKITPTLAVSNIVGKNPIIQLYIPGLGSDAGKYAIAIEGQGFQPGTSVV